ncbi:hypothetical protein HK405_002052 [Cladochytrium tenue]|nr:hypothetical protein HK405_002052 [Cladochytrium tenue]
MDIGGFSVQQLEKRQRCKQAGTTSSSKMRGVNPSLASSVDFIESGFNKFHGRFLLGLMAPTRDILMPDDDAEIDKSTVRRCIDNINTPGRRGVYGGFGHLRGSPERGTEYHPWPNVNIDRKQHPDFYEMEYMSSHWCFETAWLDYFAKERPWTWETGEDMHLSLAVRKFLNLNTYGGVLTRDAPPLPPKGHTATVGRFLEMREHLFDHTLGRGNKIADVRPTIDTLVYVEDASHIDRLIALLDACPDGDAPTGGAASAAWAWPCSIGKTAAVYRGSAVDQDSEFRHPVSHFDLRKDFGHERDAVPLATSAADLVPSLAGVLQNVGPTAFVYAEIEGDAEVVAARHVDSRAWTKGVYGVYRGAVRLAFDAYWGTRKNVKFFERETRGKAGDFPTTKAYSWRGGAMVCPH